MPSFSEFWGYLESARHSPLMTSSQDQRALKVIKAGKELREEDETAFWDEFISLCGNADGLAELFGVSREKVTGWPSRIKDLMQDLDRHTAELPSQKQKTEMIPTGETGAVNVDPNMGYAR